MAGKEAKQGRCTNQMLCIRRAAGQIKGMVKMKSLFVCWWREGKWVAKPFTGNESWDNLREPEDYNETVVLVVAENAGIAERMACSRPALTFPQVLVSE